MASHGHRGVLISEPGCGPIGWLPLLAGHHEAVPLRPNEGPGTLFAPADSALYSAKARGRNRIASA